MAKVVYVIDDLGLGGAQRQLVELVKAIPTERYAPHVISLSTEKVAYAEAIREAGVPLTLIPQAGTWSWSTLWRLYRALRAEAPAVVHTWLFTADLYGRLAAWLAGVPVMISAVRSVEPDKPMHYVVADRLLRHVTDAFTVNAHAVGEVLASRERIDPAKIHIIYNGVNVGAFDPTKTNGAVRRQLAIDQDVPLIGVIGRLAPVKDQATFLRAAGLVLCAVPKARFLVVGSGPLQAELQHLIKALRIEEQVHFLASQSAIDEVFGALDVVVVSSRYEGCCNVILEAMAMAKPVIATAVGGNPELVLHGQTGWLVPPEDPRHLAEAISTLLRDPSLRQAMGQAARRRTEAQFGLPRVVEETAALYARVLASQSQRKRPP